MLGTHLLTSGLTRGVVAAAIAVGAAMTIDRDRDDDRTPLVIAHGQQTQPAQDAERTAAPTLAHGAPVYSSKHVTAQIGHSMLINAATTGADESTTADDVRVSVGHSTLIKAPWLVKQVSVANPEIADVQPTTPDQVLVVGKQIGSTDVTMWSEDGQTWQARILVEVDVARIQADLSRFLPGSKLTLNQSQQALVVAGSLRRAEQTEALTQYMESAGLKWVDMTSVAGVHQVMIRVRVAEASRKAIRALGVNAVHTGNDFVGGSLIGGNPNGVNIGLPKGMPANSGLPLTVNTDSTIGSAVTLFGGFPDADLQLFLEALAENQYMRILAEPTLVALSGEEASFLAGGEFPIPIVQGTGGGSSISVEFKEFGIRLKFKPVVLGNGTVRLVVAPEVSELSDDGSVTLSGFRIPSLLTRKAETTLVMKDGQSFAMAGLLDRSIAAKASKVPGLGNLPVLGSLFRSVRYERGDTELVVLATISLVEPMNEGDDMPVPGELHREPDDWQLYINGEIEGAAPGKISPDEAEWMKRRGLHRLKGPGAWVTYESTPTRIAGRRR
ncbi:MAG: hypothetical protein CMJ18_27715 [Phycisphaeraceae bacterium]|nr:hypothetical protein [Phycisphaeraceae bacterium]